MFLFVAFTNNSIEEGNNDIDLESPFGLINFEKRLMIAKVITDLRLYQQRGYALERNIVQCEVP
jgi:hypothetical protein